MKVIFIIAIVIFNLISMQLINALTIKRKFEDSIHWQNVGITYLKKVLKNPPLNVERAKNIVIFIGDGMGPTTVTAGRIYKGQQLGGFGEDETLIFEDFPFTGLAKTYNVDKQVPDSAGTATAIFTGIKTRYGVIGMDATTSPTDANRGRLDSVLDWAVAAGKRTGLVTTTRITHATPASLYAKIHHRDWECDTEVPRESRGIYKDIARQLIEDEPGNLLNVILGGGLSPLGAKNPIEKSAVQFEGDTEDVCSRADGKNLTSDWLKSKPSGRSIFLSTRDQLLTVNTTGTDYLLGLFRNNHITYAIAREPEEPSLSEMVQQALRVLTRKNSNGFFLMVEGGRIDQAHHQNYAHAAMQEVVEFDAAVNVALALTDPSETLIIVTADHSHSMTLNGYPLRGQDILGLANKTGKEPAYETLTYANGPGFYDHRANDTQQRTYHGTWVRVDEIAAERRAEPTYRHMATLPLKDETHGGEDVAVYATGPGSNLIRGTFEQNYLAYVMSYAGCLGPVDYLNKKCSERSAATSSMWKGSKGRISPVSTTLLGIVLYWFLNI